ncbi:hypothetical protein E6W39_09245 [Kitasatospora acidiphila]|uniref:Beta-ketoacyl synthase N-terminal domain-containing protein n=1 Tax=Kitasatospora acidiphila TaxID=2567942 RepID=A0A540W0B7_9ACTN|nr:hypothetical protein [Kitasatospora acidiphila]TQF02421.1 hypothetical protein E6W39_09245 [Kitasatospora acidiphila]
MFEFNLTQIALCALDHVNDAGEPGGLPTDLYEVIGTTSDQFRDWFTRVCLYLVRTAGPVPAERTDETVVLGTEYGNTAALARLQREAATQGRRLSAQYFPNATSSSASAFVNMSIGATGRNMTLNAARLTPVLTLWQALVALDRGRSAGSRVLVGDVYSPEALLDAGLDTPDLACRSGLTHATFAAGREYRAEFDLHGGQEGAGVGDGQADGGSIELLRPGREAELQQPDQPYGRNTAFITADFLHLVRGLQPGEQARLSCRDRRRSATVTVTRQEESND